MGLVEVLENNGNVHVDYNHKVDNNERDKVDDWNKGKATVSIRKTWKYLVNIKNITLMENPNL